jgi:hypothetical protein
LTDHLKLLDVALSEGSLTTAAGVVLNDAARKGVSLNSLRYGDVGRGIRPGRGARFN